MTQTLIGTGTNPNDGTGDTPRTVGMKINANGLELQATRALRNLQADFMRRRQAARISNPQINGVMPSPPTIAMTNTQPTALGSGTYNTPRSLPNPTYPITQWSPLFNFLGCGIGLVSATRLQLNTFSNAGGLTPTQVAAGTSQNRGNGPRVEFNTDAPYFAVILWNASSQYRVIVDGVYATASYQSSVDSSGSACYMTIDFSAVGGRKTRNIQVEVGGGGYFGGVMIAQDDVLYPPKRSPFRVIVPGDSYVQGPNPNAMNNFARRLGDFLGIPDTVCSGLGGTGYYAGTVGSTTLIDRKSDPLGYGATMNIICMGINDASAVNTGTLTRAQVQARILATLPVFAQQSPDMPTFVTGNFYNSSYGTAYTAASSGPNPNMEADIQAGVAAAIADPTAVANANALGIAVPRMVFIPVNGFLTGNASTGLLASGAQDTTALPNGSGSADMYLNSDRTHINALGEDYYSRRLADAIETAFLSMTN